MGKVEVPEARVKALTSFKRAVNKKDLRAFLGTVGALTSFKRPVNKKDLRAFLGTVGYYRRFIPDYALWACSLNNAPL